MNYKQLIIARKDLGMSAGKLAVQVSHASMAFLTNQIKNHNELVPEESYRCLRLRPDDYSANPQLDAMIQEAKAKGISYIYYKLIKEYHPGATRPYKIDMLPVTKEEFEENMKYLSTLVFDRGSYENWIDGSFTKILCEAKNKNKLLAAARYGEELGLVEGRDFFLIKDNCLTELTPEEPDENSPTGGRTLTCIGFRPLPADICEKISKKYQLWRES